MFGIILFLGTNSISQDLKSIDSLKSLLSWDNEIDLANELRKSAIQARKEGNFQSSFYALQEANKLFKKNKDFAGCARVLNSLGLLFWHQNNTEEALHYYYQAARINDSLDLEIELAKNYLNIGNTLSFRNSFKPALVNYLRAEKLFLKNISAPVDSIRMAYILTSRGNIFADIDNPEKNYDSALQMYDRAHPIYIKIGSQTDIAGSYNNYGLVYEGLGDQSDDKLLLEQALSNYQKALELRTEEYYRMLSFLNIGNIYRKLKFYSRAQKSYKQAIDIAIKIDSKQDVMNIIENLVLNNLSRNQNQEALDYFKRYDELKDTLYHEERARQFEELQTKYETEKKEQQLALQTVKLNLSTAENRTLMTTLLVAVGFSFIILIIFQQRQKALRSLREREADLRLKEQELHAQQVDQMVRDQELKSINAMLEGEEKERKRIAEDLHDRVGSMLSAMKLQTNTADTKMTGLLDETVEEVRRISHNLETKVLNRFGLVAALEDLAEKINAAEKINFELQHLDLTERLDNKVEIHAYRIVQELVSNALKHSQATEIITQVNRIDDQLIITVEDNGVGFNSLEVKENDTGMGLKNVMSRAHELNGNFNIDSGKGNGTTVTVDFPL